MRPYSVISGMDRRSRPGISRGNFGIPGSRVSRAPRNDWKTKTTHVQARSDHGKAAFRPANRRIFRRLRQAGICSPRVGDALGRDRRSRNLSPFRAAENPVAAAGGGQPQEAATLVLRVEGPMALEIQHASDVVLERVNRFFFGWSAVGRLALRQAPLSRRPPPTASRAPDPKSVAKSPRKPCRRSRTSNCGPPLARLGASIKRN